MWFIIWYYLFSVYKYNLTDSPIPSNGKYRNICGHFLYLLKEIIKNKLYIRSNSPVPLSLSPIHPPSICSIMCKKGIRLTLSKVQVYNVWLCSRLLNIVSQTQWHNEGVPVPVPSWRCEVIWSPPRSVTHCLSSVCRGKLVPPLSLLNLNNYIILGSAQSSLDYYGTNQQ